MGVRTGIVNLKEGWPTSPQALARLTTELQRARQDGVGLLKIIHGYGSSGEGGVIREAVQAELVRLEKEGRIGAFIAGEDWRISNEATWAVVSKHRELKKDRDLGRGNRGISVVVL
jgi:Smr domain